jgi:hypothetical protein
MARNTQQQQQQYWCHHRNVFKSVHDVEVEEIVFQNFQTTANVNLTLKQILTTLLCSEVSEQ